MKPATCQYAKISPHVLQAYAALDPRFLAHVLRGSVSKVALHIGGFAPALRRGQRWCNR